MLWIWWIVGGVFVIIIIMLIIIYIVMTMHKNETNCDRLRRLGERGYYKDE
jgi:uncharacterized membrane protein